MTSYSFPDIVLVSFPFTDQITSKKRPILILNTSDFSKHTGLIIVGMITSTLAPLWPGDYILKEWEKCGLLHPSKIRLGKIATLEMDIVLKKLGSPPSPEIQKIKKIFKNVFSALA